MQFSNKILSSVSEEVAQEIHHQFPYLRGILEMESDGGMLKLAISIFDHWLDDEAEWHLMNCFGGSERRERERKWMAHWTALFDLTPVYTIRSRGRWPHKCRLVLKRYSSRDGFLQRSRPDVCRSPSQFVVLPELGCIYVEGWDDTNVVYFHEPKKIKPLLALAAATGLHVLSFERT